MRRLHITLPAIVAIVVMSAASALAQSQAVDDDVAMDGAPAVSNESIDWSLLGIDALTLMDNPATRAPQNRRPSVNAPATTWSSRDNANGSAALTVKQPVTPFWDTNVGVDMSVARENDAAFSQSRPDQFQPWDRTERSTGTAWATMAAPGVGSLWDKTAVEARVDPFEDRSKFGTRISKSVPLANDQYTLTLQNGFNLQQHGVIPGLPLPGRAARTVEIDRTARLSINDAGLSLIAGQTLSSTDERWLGKIGAEQKLFGGINVTGSVSQMPDGVLNKSLSAGFKRSW